MIKLIVNNVALDFEPNKNLPFTTTIKVDDFFKIGSSVSTHLDNLANSIVIPSTANNQKALRTHKNAEWYDFKAIDNGMTLFKGQCFASNHIVKGQSLDTISLTLKDVTNVLFEQLSDLYLSQLDLGTQLWTNTEIENSWNGNVSNYKGVFAPILYGTLSTHQTGNKLTEFVNDDFRFSLYVYHIIHEIFNEFGYTLESNLVESNLFKHIVYLNSGKRPTHETPLSFGLSGANVIGLSNNGKKLGFSGGFIDANHYQNDNFIVANYTGIYRFESSITGNFTSYGLEKGQDIIALFTETNVIEILLQKGDVITFFSDNNTTTISGGINIQLKSDAYEFSTFKVNSCLPRIKANIFLKGLTEMFNGIWKVNHTHKKVYFESRFDNPISQGWYSNEIRNKSDIKLHSDNNIGSNTKFINDIVLAYKDGQDGISKYLKEDNSNSIPLNAAKVEIKQRDTKTIKNSIFEVLHVGLSQSSYGLELPLMLPSDYKKGDELPNPTFETYHKLGLKSNTTSIKFDGVVKQAPVVSQKYAVDGVILSFSDNSNGKGLVDTFFKKYLYVLKYSDVVTTKALINKHLATNEDFKKLVEYQDKRYVLLELNQYDLSELKECGVTLIEYKNIKTNSINIESNWFGDTILLK